MYNEYDENVVISRTSEAWYKKNNRVIIPNLFDIRLNVTQSKIWEMFDGHYRISDILNEFSTYSKDEIYSFIRLCDRHNLIEFVKEDDWDL